ncbi:fibronectin type III domain-containing protein, partial [Gammaproteobacteria bacterium]|nr:fibronectin type III domain-containing protein [Gammaproteobacteria bacterium]
MTSILKIPALMRFALPLMILLLLSGLAVAQTVTRGPYLQSPTPNSVIVKWRTDVATDSVVSYATIDGSPSAAADVSATTEHEVLLSGLSADTLYNYTVGSSAAALVGGNLANNGDGEHFFTTAPASGSDKPTRVWVIGDSGTKNADAAAVRDAYKAYTGSRGTD